MRTGHESPRFLLQYPVLMEAQASPYIKISPGAYTQAHLCISLEAYIKVSEVRIC